MRSNTTGGAGAGGDTTPDPGTADPGIADLAALLAQMSAHAHEPAPASRAAHIDRIALLEQVKAAAAAAQHTEIVEFARAEVEHQIARGDIDPRKVGRGIADQIALASKVSPWTGSTRLNTARILDSDLPGVRDLLRTGHISEDLAGRVVSETRHLTPELRRGVDAQIVAAGIDQLSPRAAAATAKRLAYETDPAAYVARGRTARADRRVSLRPAPDTMAVLSALLPVEQGVAALAALRKHADTAVGTGDARSRDQIMADTLVERLTGQAQATDVNVEVGVVIPVDALLDPDSGETAEVLGHGPVPAGIARDILATTNGKRWLRRLFAHPTSGAVIDADPKRRFFDGVLTKLIRIRDGDRCTDAFCDAAARNIDHIHPARADGPTSFVNGRATCERGNQVREIPGWTVDLVHDGLGDQPHTVRTTTPTGHTYTSRAGP